jgi:DNA-binding NarL/FixJ family response regulator
VSSANHDVITLFIIDDHLLVSESLQLAAATKNDIRALGAAVTLAEGLQLVSALQPDVVLIDAHLPDGSALDGIVAIRERSPHTAVVVLSASTDHHAAMQALERGAAGYLVKEQKVDEVFDGIRAAHAGDRPIAPQLINALVSRLSSGGESVRHLSRREVEVLRLLAEGMSTADLSTHLQLSRTTVRNHIQSAIRRLGAHSKLEAVAIAQREGLINAP